MRTGTKRGRRKALWPILLLMLTAAGCAAAAAVRLRQAARAEAAIAVLRAQGGSAAIVYVRVKDDASAAAPVEAAAASQAGTTAEEEPLSEEARAGVERVLTLQRQNPELVGWLTMTGAEVDYPVMQSPDRPNFYLDHDFAGAESRAGLPYIDEACAIDAMHRIIYGHNMKNGAMFGRLKRYQDAEFYAANRAFTLDTAAGREQYEVIAVYEAEIREDAAFPFWEYTNIQNEDEYRRFAANALARNVHGAGDMPRYGQKLVTLVTCIRYRPDDRLVVIGAQIPE